MQQQLREVSVTMICPRLLTATPCGRYSISSMTEYSSPNARMHSPVTSYTLMSFFFRSVSTILSSLVTVTEFGQTWPLHKAVTRRPLVSNINRRCPSESAVMKKFSAMNATSEGVLMASLTPVSDLGSLANCQRNFRFGGCGLSGSGPKINPSMIESVGLHSKLKEQTVVHLWMVPKQKIPARFLHSFVNKTFQAHSCLARSEFGSSVGIGVTFLSDQWC